MKRLVVDLDGTITLDNKNGYENATPNDDLIVKLKEYKSNGFEIIISTSRNVRTYNSNVGKINANTLPVIIKWLDEHDVPYDEIYVGKPWCGTEGFYIDDKAVRPSEFTKYSYPEILDLIQD